MLPLRFQVHIITHRTQQRSTYCCDLQKQSNVPSFLVPCAQPALHWTIVLSSPLPCAEPGSAKVDRPTTWICARSLLAHPIGRPATLKALKKLKTCLCTSAKEEQLPLFQIHCTDFKKSMDAARAQVIVILCQPASIGHMEHIRRFAALKSSHLKGACATTLDCGVMQLRCNKDIWDPQCLKSPEYVFS